MNSHSKNDFSIKYLTPLLVQSSPPLKYYIEMHNSIHNDPSLNKALENLKDYKLEDYL